MCKARTPTKCGKAAAQRKPEPVPKAHNQQGKKEQAKITAEGNTSSTFGRNTAHPVGRKLQRNCLRKTVIGNGEAYSLWSRQPAGISATSQESWGFYLRICFWSGAKAFLRVLKTGVLAPLFLKHWFLQALSRAELHSTEGQAEPQKHRLTCWQLSTQPPAELGTQPAQPDGCGTAPSTLGKPGLGRRRCSCPHTMTLRHTCCRASTSTASLARDS